MNTDIPTTTEIALYAIMRHDDDLTDLRAGDLITYVACDWDPTQVRVAYRVCDNYDPRTCLLRPSLYPMPGNVTVRYTGGRYVQDTYLTERDDDGWDDAA